MWSAWDEKQKANEFEDMANNLSNFIQQKKMQCMRSFQNFEVISMSAKLALLCAITPCVLVAFLCNELNKDGMKYDNDDVGSL